MTPCSVCGQPTDLACSDCAIETGRTVHVCKRSECRDQHEKRHKPGAGNSGTEAAPPDRYEDFGYLAMCAWNNYPPEHPSSKAVWAEWKDKAPESRKAWNRVFHAVAGAIAARAVPFEWPAGAKLAVRELLNGAIQIVDEAEDAPLVTISGHNGVDPNAFLVSIITPLIDEKDAVAEQAVREREQYIRDTSKDNDDA